MPFNPTQFKRTLIYQDQATFSDLRTTFELIREFDRAWEIHRRRLRWLMLWSGLGIPLCFLAAVGMVSPVMLVVMFGCIVALIATIVLHTMNRKYDLSNRRYELTKELTGALSCDMKKDGQFDLRLDLSPADHNAKKKANQKIGVWNVTFFEDPWLTLRGQLADGTTFYISVLERLQKRWKKKRSISGKTKYKRKSKCATSIVIQLSPKAKTYPQLAAVESRVSEYVKIPDWAMLKSTSGKSGKLLLKVLTIEDWAVKPDSQASQYDGRELCFSMLHSLYQALHESQRLSVT